MLTTPVPPSGFSRALITPLKHLCADALLKGRHSPEIAAVLVSYCITQAVPLYKAEAIKL